MPESSSPVEEIKQKLDIVEIIQDYLRLHKAGGNYKALCPFHREKTPSFMVSPEKQIFHCFGCGEGGDVFGFVQKMEGIEFPEALRILAKRAGVKLTPRNPELYNKKTKMMDVCKWASAYYHKVLLEAKSAQVARDYLAEREVSEDIIESFRLGFAPEDWERLNNFLQKKGFSEEDIFQSGLTIKSDKGTGQYDRFRNRLMFPIRDVHGNVVGFTGRILDPEDQAAKYINTPKTLVYDKSNVIYGLDKAKQKIKSEKLAVVVEGNMDVLASHQVGVTNVVASSGTALTENQINLLKRYSENIAIAFDADLAGEGAAKRGIELAMQAGLNVKVITLPYGKDPDECIKNDPKLWEEAIAQSQSIMDYYMETTFSRLDMANVEDKKQAAKILLPIVNKIPDSIEQTHYLQQISRKLNVDEKILRESLTKTTKKKSSQPAQEEKEKGASQHKSRSLTSSQELLGIALKYYENLDYIVDNCQAEYLADPTLQNLYKNLIVYYTKNHRFDPEEFRKQLEKENDELVKQVDILEMLASQLYAEFDEDMFKTEIDSIIRFLNRNCLSHRLQEIEKQLKNFEESESQPDSQEEERKLLEEFDQLSKQLNQID